MISSAQLEGGESMCCIFHGNRAIPIADTNDDLKPLACRNA